MLTFLKRLSLQFKVTLHKEKGACPLHSRTLDTVIWSIEYIRSFHKNLRKSTNLKIDYSKNLHFIHYAKLREGTCKNAHLIVFLFSLDKKFV